MARVFAEFEELAIDDDIFCVRRDTRLYFADQLSINATFGRCLGAFYLINPGSATPTSEPCSSKLGAQKWAWGSVDYSREQLMPVLLGAMDDALDILQASNPEKSPSVRNDGYIQLLNLSYIKNAKDGKSAIAQWRPLIAKGIVADDRPRFPQDVQFIVFGWGKSYYRHHIDGERVASALSSWLPSNATLLFPAAAAVRKGKQFEAVRLGSPTVDSIGRELKRENNYPCGAQSERNTYPQLYRRAVAPILAQLLARLGT